MKLYLIRHGRAGHKEDGCYSNSELTDHGIEQIKRLSKVLKKIQIDKVYCSPIKRTMQTLEIIKKDLEDTDIEICNEIVERSRGIYEKRPDEELSRAIEESGLGSADFRPEGGENHWDLKKRAEKFLDKIKERENENVAIISHDGFITAMLMNLLNLPVEESKFIRINSGSITKIELDKYFKVKNINVSNCDHFFAN